MRGGRPRYEDRQLYDSPEERDDYQEGYPATASRYQQHERHYGYERDELEYSRNGNALAVNRHNMRYTNGEYRRDGYRLSQDEGYYRSRRDSQDYSDLSRPSRSPPREERRYLNDTPISSRKRNFEYSGLEEHQRETSWDRSHRPFRRDFDRAALEDEQGSDRDTAATGRYETPADLSMLLKNRRMRNRNNGVESDRRGSFSQNNFRPGGFVDASEFDRRGGYVQENSRVGAAVRPHESNIRGSSFPDNYRRGGPSGFGEPDRPGSRYNGNFHRGSGAGLIDPGHRGAGFIDPGHRGAGFIDPGHRGATFSDSLRRGRASNINESERRGVKFHDNFRQGTGAGFNDPDSRGGNFQDNFRRGGEASFGAGLSDGPIRGNVLKGERLDAFGRPNGGRDEKGPVDSWAYGIRSPRPRPAGEDEALRDVVYEYPYGILNRYLEQEWEFVNASNADGVLQDHFGSDKIMPDNTGDDMARMGYLASRNPYAQNPASIST